MIFHSIYQRAEGLRTFNQLDHIQSAGSTWLGSYFSALKYVGSASQILQDGYYKVRS